MIALLVLAITVVTFIILPVVATAYLIHVLFGIEQQTALALALVGFVAARLARNGFH